MKSSDDETNNDNDSPSPEASISSPPPISDIHPMNSSHKDKKSPPSPPPPPKSGKDSDDDEAPPPNSNDSSSPSPEQSPSQKSPPPPSLSPPPAPPVAPPPPPPANPPPSPPVKKSPQSIQPPTSSPPTLSSNWGNLSPPPPPPPVQPLAQVNFPSLIQNVPPPPTNHSSLPHSHSVKSRGHGGSGSDGDTAKFVGFGFAGVFLGVFFVVCFLVVKSRNRKRGAVHDLSHIQPHMNAAGEDWRYYGLQPLQDDHYKNGSQMGTSESVQPMNGQTAFSYESIVEITDGFSSQNIIGEGGFGCVYKGWLPDGRVVAVKKLKAGSGQGDREFRAEVEIISRVHHRHLVSLVGYCITEEEKILMYEFVPNGTLNHHLHGKGMLVLDWEKRMKIAIGAARGLAYLHEDCHPKIIHRDIKSANILLDDAYVVSDFGLARLTDDANTHVSTRVMGTFGYMAPEYATSGKLTDRSDVFSFGVVLLELLTGRKSVDQTQPLGEESLVEWARPLLIHAVETGDFSKLIDTRLENLYVESEVLRMIEAAAACVRHSAPKRPRMLQVARALDSGGELVDLSNGMKYGQSTVYGSGQYDEEMTRFRMMNGASFNSSEFDFLSEDYSSRELSGFRHAFAQEDSSGGESTSQAFTKDGSSGKLKG